MNTQTRRIGLILLVGVVAVAGAMILRSGDKSKDAAPVKFASVLAADDSGAITQTDDGTTRGYDRQGNVRWTQPPIIVERADGQKMSKVSNFFCAGNCPDAYGNSAANRRNTLLKFGFGDDGAGTPLGSPLDATDIVLRGALSATTLVVRRPQAGKRKFEYVFVSAPQAIGGSKDLSSPVSVAPGALVTVLASADKSRVVAVEGVGTKDGKSAVTTLRWFVRASSKWEQTGKPISAKGTGACFSSDGERVALSGQTTQLMQFGGGSQIELPIEAKFVGCAFSDDGVTFSYAAAGNKKDLLVEHFDNTGVKVWNKSFVGASSFNERAGDSNLFQLTDEAGTLLLNAQNGATVANNEGQPASFPAGGNAFVTASANGKPTWENR